MCNDKPSYEELVEEKNGWRRLHDKYLKKCEELELENAKLLLQYDQLDDIFRQRGFDLSQSMSRTLELEKENVRLRDVLKELRTLVWGECPSLLNEDSGGDSRLDLEIEDCIGNTLKEALYG